jgi:hypothetical protein
MSGGVVGPPIEALQARLDAQEWKHATALGRELAADQAAAMALALAAATA